MGEALIVSRGSGSGGSSGKTLISQIFIENTVWKAPKIPDQNFSVRIFGGGGAGFCNATSGNAIAGGGGGWMNNAILKINAGEEIPITIGRGGYNGTNSGNGEISSFGTYLSALGGTNGTLYQNTSTQSRFAVGGYGGSGGGAGGTGSIGGAFNYSNISEDDLDCIRFCSRGFQFGGGGGIYGGLGGKWGGGGGINHESTSKALGGCLYENSQNMYEITGYSGLAGNGGNKANNNAENGINTIGIGLEFEGSGSMSYVIYADASLNKIEDNKILAGGGGYGGNGSCIISNINFKGYQLGFTTAGGGYGANGGTVYVYTNRGYAGGGGYGGDGGDTFKGAAGGGGGYGKLGKGGGYTDVNYINDNDIVGSIDGGIAAGGGGYNQGVMGKGGNGICIIQYYI